METGMYHRSERNGSLGTYGWCFFYSRSLADNCSVPASAVSSSLFSSLSTAQTSKVGASDASISSMISAAAASKASDTGAHKESAKPTREEAKEMIKNDLFLWSSKFSASSVKTLADLKSTIDEISDKAYSKKVKDVGNEILSLQKLVDNGFITLKAEIQSLTRDLTPESTPEEKEAARESLIAATRRLGTEIRDKTQQIRKEAELYLAKVYDDVSEAADQHLEVLDGINEMGMQELGMKWAWMDYVSYKDWAKYHDLKKEMKESRTAIIRSAEANDKLQEITHWVENEWEGKATDIAKHAAEELKRIKKIGKRKFELADASEDFSDSIIPVVVQKAGQQVLGGAEKFKVAVAEKEKKIINGVEKLKIDIAGVKEHSIKQKIINGAKEFKVSIPGEKEDSIKEKIIEAADDVRSKVDEAIYGTPTPVTESIASAAESVISQVSEKIYGTEPNAVEKAATAISSVVSSASSAVSSATERIKINVPGGVEAGFVAAADSILFDDDDSVVDNVKSRYAEASMAVSQAINEALYRTEPSVHESLMSKASELSESAVSVASSILYGTPTPVTEALASIATDKYSAAVAAASRVLYGTPTPTHELLLQQLKDVYAQATAAAQDAYSASNFGATKVEKPVSESIISAASEKYASALSVADVAYASILSAGSDARRGYDATVADAQRVLNEAASAASIKIYGTPQPASESIMSVAREKYYSASQEAQKNYDSWYTVASEQIYGTPGPFYATILSSASAAASAVSQQVEDTASVIAEKADDAASAVSTAILGAPAPTGVSASAASIVSEAEASVSDVQDLAALRYDQLQALVSELVHGKEPTFSESVMLRFSEALYGTPTPVLSQASSLAASATSAAAEAAASLHPAIEQLVTDAVRRVKTAVSIDEIERTGREAVESLSAAVGGLYGGTREEEKSYKDQVLLYATGRINRAVANAQKSYRKVKDEL